MKRYTLIILVLFMLFRSYGQTSQNSLAFDLAEPGTSQPSKNMNLEIIYLENAFPKRQYNVTISKSPFIYEPLTFGGGVPASASPCTALEKKYNEVYDFATKEDPKKTEKDLKNHLTELNNLKKNSGCIDGDLLKKIDNLNSACIRIKKLPSTVAMVESNNYEVVIEAGEKKLTYSFSGKGRGRWLMNYGFLFSSKALEPRRYFLEQLGDDQFQIKEREKYDLIDLRFTPMIFFSHFLDKNLNKTWNNSFSLGLGFNTEAPVISAGYNGMYNQNIGFSFGVVFYQQQKLDGRYKVEQILKENLDEDKLYDKSFFRPNLFLSLNIRLGENPYKTDDKEAKK